MDPRVCLVGKRVNFSDTLITYFIARRKGLSPPQKYSTESKETQEINNTTSRKNAYQPSQRRKNNVYLSSTRGSVAGRRKDMRGRTRFYRVHLIAYDIAVRCWWHFPPVVPILSPIPITPVLQKRGGLPRKIRLIRVP